MTRYVERRTMSQGLSVTVHLACRLCVAVGKVARGHVLDGRPLTSDEEILPQIDVEAFGHVVAS